jgi:hypothetical protein
MSDDLFENRIRRYWNNGKLSCRAPNFAQKAGNTIEEVTVRKSPLACPEKFGERGFRGVFDQAKNVDSSQLSHISPNLSLVSKACLLGRSRAISLLTLQTLNSTASSLFIASNHSVCSTV